MQKHYLFFLSLIFSVTCFYTAKADQNYTHTTRYFVNRQVSDIRVILYDGNNNPHTVHIPTGRTKTITYPTKTAKKAVYGSIDEEETILGSDLNKYRVFEINNKIKTKKYDFYTPQEKTKALAKIMRHATQKQIDKLNEKTVFLQ